MQPTQPQSEVITPQSGSSPHELAGNLAGVLSGPFSQVERQKLPSDAELLELFVESGSREAVETLISRYASMVASVCRCTVADPASAEDAFQATFLVLLKSAKSIQRRGSVAAWLHGVAYRTASRLRKQRLVQAHTESTEEVIALDEKPADPMVTLARQMELEALDQELQKLPARLRDVLVEHYLLGNTAPQIAERMELSTAAVEGRIRRGRQALRRVLAQRGISLSIVAASTAWFQQQVQATEATAWTASFLEAHYPVGASSPNFSASPNVSSLVQGELTMFGATYSKIIAVASALLLIGGLFSYNAIGDESGQEGDMLSSRAQVRNSEGRAERPLTIKSLAETAPPIVAQLAAAGSAPIVQVQSESQPATSAAAEQGAKPTPQTIVVEHVQWSPPDSDAPAWLDTSLANSKFQEEIRGKLSQVTEVEFVETSLSDAVKVIGEELGVDVYLDDANLKEYEISPNTPVTLKARGPFREILRRLMMKIDSENNAEFDYIVRDSGIEITTREEIESEPATRYYDLSFVLPNSNNADSLIIAIQNQIEPDAWVQAGGQFPMSLVGSMLIVGCSESAHFQIQNMLSRLAAMNRMNLEKEVPSKPMQYYPGGMGGMGGGMGGMGGGMGGMGGGMGGMGGGMF